MKGALVLFCMISFMNRAFPFLRGWFSTAGAVIQNKAGAYTQLQEGSNQNKRAGTGLRGLLVERPGSFAAAPYLLRR